MKIISILITISFFAISAIASEKNHSGTLFQVATISSLAQGVYDGNYRYEQLFQHGDFGLGTFNRLDGEMVAVDGKFYQITSTGKLRLVQPDDLTPFAEVTFFSPKEQFDMQAVKDFQDLMTLLEKSFKNKNIPYAFRIDGDFSNLKLRSVPAQQKPYPPLVEAVKHQAIFNLQDTHGTIVGFWFPQYWAGIAVPGFHLHFVNADRTIGGHVLELAIVKGHVSLEPLYTLKVSLPDTQSFAQADLSDERIHAAINQAEKNPVAK